jgi:hypothetical protein
MKQDGEITWTGFSLPPDVPASSVQYIYGFAIMNHVQDSGAGDGYVQVLCNDATHNTNGFYVLLGGSTMYSPLLQYNGLMDGTPSTFNYASATCVATDSQSLNFTATSHEDFNMIGLVVFYTGTTHGLAGLQIVPPLSYNQATQMLSISPGAYPTLIDNGTAALSTTSIAANSCATPAPVPSKNAVTTDLLQWSPSGDWTGITGYVPQSTGMLAVYPYLTNGYVNFKVCNPTDAPIIPGAASVNWMVLRRQY